MGTYYYYVNADDETYKEWNRIGINPYLGAIDYPANYIYQMYLLNKREGIFDFQNSGAENSETLSNVYIEIYTRGYEDPDYGYPIIKVYVWDGSSWQWYDTPILTGTFGWKTIDISAFINSWAKVDGCRAYLVTQNVGDQGVDVDCMRLKVITTVAPKAKAGLHPSKPLSVINAE